jgi:hypothetical protein
MMGFAEPVIGPATPGRTRWLNPSYGLRSTLAKGVPLRAGFWLGNRNGDESQGRCRFIRDTS